MAMEEGFTQFPNVYRAQHEWPDYLHPAFLAKVDRAAVRTIFEVGCCDGSDTLQLRREFDAEIHAFECNPDMLPRTRKTLAGSDRVHLVERAVWDEEGEVPFYPVVRTRGAGGVEENPGASSCFRARPDYVSEYTQKAVTVAAIRLDRYCAEREIGQVDLLCMDAQGAELHVLRGLGEYIARVQYVISEIEVLPIYVGQSIYPEIHAYLTGKGFEQTVEVYRDAWFSDFLYTRRDQT